MKARGVLDGALTQLNPLHHETIDTGHSASAAASVL